MDARELTIRYHEDHQSLRNAEKQIEYLTQECQKLRRMVEDMQIDIKMMQNMRR